MILLPKKPPARGSGVLVARVVSLAFGRHLAKRSGVTRNTNNTDCNWGRDGTQ